MCWLYLFSAMLYVMSPWDCQDCRYSLYILQAAAFLAPQLPPCETHLKPISSSLHVLLDCISERVLLTFDSHCTDGTRGLEVSLNLICSLSASNGRQPQGGKNFLATERDRNGPNPDEFGFCKAPPSIGMVELFLCAFATTRLL